MIATTIPRGIHGQVVDAIGRRIVQGELAPGQVLDTERLEAELGVSRTVIREAMRVLAAKGLVGARQKRGTFVRPREDWSLLDAEVLAWQYEGRTDVRFLDSLHEVRTIFEPAGARLAAERRSEEDLATMEEALETMRRADGDVKALIAADLRFHRAVLSACRNELLEQLERVIEAALKARDEIAFAWTGYESSAFLLEHQAVLDAIGGRSPDGAEAAMRTLLESAARDLAGIPRQAKA